MDTISAIRKDHSSLPVTQAEQAGSRRTLRAILAALDQLEDMAERRRSRRALLWLNDAQLKDIGLSRADAFREARRSFFL